MTRPPPRSGGRFVPEEAKVFVRMSAFGVVVGAGYGVLTREPAGVVLLLAFGLAAGVAAIAIVVGSFRATPATPGPTSATAGSRDDGANDDESGAMEEPAPAPGWAPLGLGIGLGGLALGAALGPWLAVGGLFLTLVAARSWLTTAVREAASAHGHGEPVDRT